MESTRTKKGLKNIKVALLFYFCYLFLTFVSRRIFIEYLGADVLGLNTTATSLLQFFNMAELGISSAVAYSLYKPLYNQDYDEVIRISSVQGWVFKNLSLLLLVISAILLAFFPYIFTNMQLPMWYAYATFIVLLLNPLFGFLFNYRQIVLTADQKQYKVTAITQIVKILKVFIQILAIVYLENGYLYWLVIEGVFSVLNTLFLNMIIKKEYPWLETSVKKGYSIRKEYKEILSKMRQVFVHKIGGYITEQSTPVIVYSFSSLLSVAIYGNYILVVKGLKIFIIAMFNGVDAGIGNLIVEGNRSKILGFFWEMFSLKFFLSFIICIAVYEIVDLFMIIWVGEQFLFDKVAVFLIVINLYIGLTRTTIDSFIAAYGLFQDVWASVVEAIISLLLTVSLGYFYGINGILAGVLITSVLIHFIWKPYFLLRCGLKYSIISYVWNYLKLLLPSLLLFFVVENTLKNIIVSFSMGENKSNFSALVNTTLYVSAFAVLLFLLLCFTSKHFRNFIARVLTLLKR